MEEHLDGRGDLETLVKEVKAAAHNGKITCPAALEIAERMGVQPGLVGRAADIAGIKITGCQLGCFKRE